ncbi:AraC family transcriptional regulator [Pseudohalioglobus lutimaris]|uniref:AraC family transcriptional regulator n=1 Tax=Pseudohalioglobus lutimaris TaxID=1737061 RepID=A0A2N5X5T5_9GAMM|nr:AraC family transcriptional regulator [Pseudohalioglobus lutimaris]PLW69847.1 AraC family transcriptional regulator [Pseudohalioglobus lutimaris]
MSDYLVRASALTGVRTTIEQLGGDAKNLLQRLGLDDVEADPESWISYPRFLLLLEQASLETDCPHFGLLLSEHQDVGILGALGFVIQQAPDLRTALRELITRFSFHNQGASVSLSVDKGIASWQFACKLQGEVPIRQQEDLVAGIGVDLLRLLWRTDWTPNAVYFAHGAPANLKPYRERFRCPLHFDWDVPTVTFDATILDTAISQANPQLHRLLETYLDELHIAHPDSFRDKVRYLIQQAMYTGDCSIERVAATLAINKRTLQRRLKAEGTSFKELLDEVRFNAARKYLRESNGSLTVLAEMLCYSDLSAFSNAFRQRFGVSPRCWKQQRMGQHVQDLTQQAR